MGRKNTTTNPTVIAQSSIALLQERFRQLQRVKEMREEREQQRPPCSQGERPSPRTMWFYHPDLVRPSRPPCGPPSCCWLDGGHGDGTDLLQGALETALSMGGSWTNQTTARYCITTSDDSPDVDTTLHL